jgi:hypothetical protein
MRDLRIKRVVVGERDVRRLMTLQSSGGSGDMKVEKGARLGHSQIVGALGRGGMGEV